MRKLQENSSYDYSDSAIKSNAFHINPQSENVTEEIMNSAIDYFVEKYDSATN